MSPVASALPVAESQLTLPPAMVAAAWIPDRGDGTYRNPVLFADYSDPDVVRVGDDFWLTASSFNHVPGLPILHSRDLVNWTLVNYALPHLVPEEHFATPRHGGGVWAPSIRFHAGKYYIYYPDPDFGLYVITTSDPRGAWTKPILICAGKGLIDPCPFWDEDGQAYLVHGWAKSRSGISNRLTLRRLTPDSLAVTGEPKTIVEGGELAGWHTIEGPKLYRRGGYYYVFAPAGGVAQGYQAVFRSRDIYGPYEAKIVLEQGRTAVNGPHQGGWVDTPKGENWFLHFQDRGPFGRVVHLQPMSWGNDGWPRMGTAVAIEGQGEPVLAHANPAVASQPCAIPAMSDEFDTERLGLAWQWQANPEPSWASLTAHRGSLRLAGVALPTEQSLWFAPNLLLQKFSGPRFVATTRLEFAPGTVGDAAGLIVFGYSYAWIGLRQTTNGPALVYASCPAANEDGVESEGGRIAVSPGAVWLRVVVSDDASCAFSYSTDGKLFHDLSLPFTATQSRWVGAKVGLFARSGSGTATSGHADFDWFRVTAP